MFVIQLYTAVAGCLLVGLLAAGDREAEVLPAGALARLGTARFQNLGLVYAVAFAPDGKTLAAGCWDGTVRLWDLATGKELRPFTGHEGWVKSVAFSPDGQTLASGGQDGSVRLWDPATGRELRRLGGHEGWIRSVVYSPDGQRLVSAGDATFRLWDAATGRELRRWDRLAEAVAFSPDGQILATSNEEHAIQLWEVATGKEIRQLAQPRAIWVRSVAFSPDGKVLATGGGYFDDRIRFWDPATGKERRRFGEHQGVITALVFSSDGKTLAARSSDDTIRLWELATGQPRLLLKGTQAGDVSLAFSPDGKLLASGSTDVTVLLWDVTGRRREGRLETVELSSRELEALWTDLAGDDAVKAYQAIWKLVAGAKQAVPFLQARLRPVAAPPDPQRITRLVADLDSERLAVRQQATDELVKLGDLAESALLEALQSRPSLEHRQRIEGLLAKLYELMPPPDQRQALRALEALEHLGTGEARQLVETLAQGAPAARLTREAKAVRERLRPRLQARP
jgi:Tol biopolymer transport system component